MSRALQKLVPTSAGASVDAVSGEEGKVKLSPSRQFHLAFEFWVLSISGLREDNDQWCFRAFCLDFTWVFPCMWEWGTW